MTPEPFPHDAPAPADPLADLRHALFTSLNHILGLTEMQIEEAPEAGLEDYVPILAEINAKGRRLLAIVESSLRPLSGAGDLERLGAHIRSEGEPALVQATTLAEGLRTTGHYRSAKEIILVSGALERLLSISEVAASRSEREGDLSV